MLLPIGGKADPVRLVFNARPLPAVAASVVEMGNHGEVIAMPLMVSKGLR
jgi:L-arabinose isomerase